MQGCYFDLILPEFNNKLRNFFLRKIKRNILDTSMFFLLQCRKPWPASSTGVICFSGSSNTCDLDTGKCMCGDNPDCLISNEGSKCNSEIGRCEKCDTKSCPPWLTTCGDDGICTCDGTMCGTKDTGNTCVSGVCVCGSESASCNSKSQLPKCLNGDAIFQLGDAQSTCKVRIIFQLVEA